ncbi:UNVERIFIED_CONTAM: cell wall-associated NlpC family hydrolase [Brevibacillus sp. OAP136]
MSNWKRKADSIIGLGKKYLGTPYLFGATPGSTRRFDCSSFTQYIYGKHGIELPRISREQSKHGRPVTLGEIRRGDLLFYKTHKRRHRKGLQKIGHVAAYLGNNHMIHATEEGGIGIINIHQYPKGVLAKARRVILD